MAQTESMEDILTSIRSGVEGAAAGAADVLELEPNDILEDAGTNGHSHGAVAAGGDEELIDINAFARNGEENPAEYVAGGDVLGEGDVPVEKDEAPALDPVVTKMAQAAPVADEAIKAAAEDEFDKLLAELGGDEAKPEVVKTDILPPVMEAAAEVGAVAEDVVMENVVAAPSEVVIPPTSGMRMVLPALEGVGGLQVAFPAEVLAAALRPMVKDWVAENLSAIVERLVKDEIGKLTQE